MKKILTLALLLSVIGFNAFSQNWLITGNSGTNPPTNFLGTIDNKALVFKTNNKERMRVDKNGQVGIGTTSPQEQLSIEKSLNLDQGNANNGAINNGTSGGAGLTFGSSSGEGIASKRTTGGNQNGLDFYTSFTNRMAITSSGNVGIGTITPSFKLDVNGSVNAASVYLNGGRFLYGPMDGTGNNAVGFNALYSNTTGYFNTANGYQALFANTTGFTNTANGYQALFSNTTGFTNTANGYQALFSNTTGALNTANGYQALYSNTTGNYNTANGHEALFSNTTGFSNTANGNVALVSNTTGSWNTANGDEALSSNTTGYLNTANGYQALFSNTTGDYNTANGSYTLFSNTTGSHNTANGYEALFSNTTGTTNTANGDEALYLNTIGYSNTANGAAALSSNTTGNYNTANGDGALGYNTTGDYNTANGLSALISNTIGTYNTADGAQALGYNTTGDYNTANGSYTLFYNTTGSHNTANGLDALWSNTTGSYNTANGYEALWLNTTGNNNTAEGYGANVNSGNYSNGSAFGNSALITASNQVRIGNSNVTSIGGYVNWSNISDGRVKKNIKQNVPGLAFINKLQPITYNLDLDGADKIVQRPEIKDMEGNIIQPLQEEVSMRQAKEQIVYTGFVAQDVEKAAQALNFDFSGVDAPKNDKDLYGLRYAEFVVPLVKAVQELSQKDDTKDSIISSQQKQIDALATRMDQLESALSQCCASYQLSDKSSIQNFNPSDQARLEQNSPNPFSQNTTIQFYIPSSVSDAMIVVGDLSGRVIQQYSNLATGNGTITISSGVLAPGTYQYSLIINGRMTDSKQMVLTK